MIMNNDKDCKFNVNDRIRIWKYKITFANRYILNWSGKFFVINKLKILCYRHM